MPDVTHCWKTGKHKHKSRGAAEAHLRHLVDKHSYKDAAAYPCPWCKGWHVGRKTKERAAFEAGERK